MKKFVIGWMTFRPEMRDRFVAVVRKHVAAMRSEEGCIFAEINLNLDGSNGAVVAECWKDQAAHDVHNATPQMKWFVKEMSELLIEGRFENIFSDDVRVDKVKFA